MSTNGFPDGRRAGAAVRAAGIRFRGMLLWADGRFALEATNQVVMSFAAAALLVALVVPVSLWGFKQLETAAAARQHSYELIMRSENLLADLVDAETGQRGYALTGDETLLEPYLAARESIADNLKALRPLAPLSAAQKSLDALAPLVDAKLAEMAHINELRRSQDMPGVLAAEGDGHGKRLMNSIRAEMAGFVQMEQDALAQHRAAFQSNMRNLFAGIITASLFALLFAGLFAYLIYREAQQRLKNLVHGETRHLLEIQEETNKRLQQANLTLQASEEKLAVTLNSIGDGVIATDAEARVTLLNPLAQRLTGWTQAQAAGRAVDEVFHIINQETRRPSTIPVMETLAHGTVHGLANHTILIARDGSERAIADSCAPIRGRDGEVVGAVLVFRDITEEYAAQQAVRDSTAQIQAILDTVVDGVITIHASGGIVERINHAAEQMFGYAAEELVGRKFSLLIPELDRDRRNGSLEYYSASAEARAAGLGREVAGQRKDGSVFPLEIAVSEMWLGGKRYFTGVLRDITARKEAEEALRKAGALQSAIFNSANFSSIATDAKGVIQIFNVGAERMLGYAAADVMNKITPADISDPQEVIARAKALSVELGTQIAPGFEALVFKASRGIEDIYELNYIRKDGSRFPAVVSVTALRDAHDAIIGYLLIGTDNTARKAVEEERALLDQALKNKNAELESAKSVAEKASLAKSDFLSSMSHELRTPLNAVLGFAQLIESGTPPPTPPQKRSLEQIIKAGWYLLELINEILDLAKIESGRLTLSREPVSLNQVMLECQAMIEPQAKLRGIGMQFPRLDTPIFVLADRTRLKQVLINLLFNAIKYNRSGGTVVVDCSMRPLDTLRISIRDTGGGILPEKLAQLFQPFNRLGKEAGAEEGTGIGLVVAKRLVELMRGTIGVDSVVGAGTMFWVELTLCAAPCLSAEAAEVAARHLPTVKTGAAPPTLLYVEDNPANMQLVEELIARRPDLRLLSAADGDLGIALAREFLPQVILMDINLPGIGGTEVMHVLRADPATAHIPIVAISANAMPADIKKGLEAGFFRYLTKPIVVSEFMDALSTALEFAAARKANEIKKELVL